MKMTQFSQMNAVSGLMFLCASAGRERRLSRLVRTRPWQEDGLLVEGSVLRKAGGTDDIYFIVHCLAITALLAAARASNDQCLASADMFCLLVPKAHFVSYELNIRRTGVIFCAVA